MGHDRRRPRIHIDEYQNTFWCWAHPFIRQLGDCYNSCPGSDDCRLLGLRVRGWNRPMDRTVSVIVPLVLILGAHICADDEQITVTAPSPDDWSRDAFQ